MEELAFSVAQTGVRTRPILQYSSQISRNICYLRFEAHGAIQNREVAIQERDVRKIYHGESHNSKDVLVHLFLSSTRRVPLF